MQHEKKPSKWKQMIKSRGYYIVLFLCLIAVGTSGYLYYRGSNSEKPAAQPSTTQESTSPTGGKAASTAPASKPTESTGTKDAFSDDTVPAIAPKQEDDSALAVSAPIDGETVQAYAMDHLAYNETTRDWRTHAGVDIAGELGAPVHAAAKGVVYAVYDDDAMGKTVVVNHANGYSTYYSNLAEDVNVSVGDTVDADTVLGVVGDTATVEVAAQPHLHFAVYQDTKVVDPSQFLAE